MAKQQEGIISTKCLEYLDELKTKGVPLEYFHRSGSGGFQYKKGIPDIYIIIGPYHIECEMKTPWGHLSTRQVYYKNKFARMGTPYINPKSFKEFKEYIDKFYILK